MTITLVSGGGNTPMNLTGWNANIVVGPYLNISSTLATTSGNITLNGTGGQIFITIAAPSTYIYSPQPYYVGLQDPNGSNYYLLNGTINFTGPWYQAILPAQQPLNVGGLDFTINVNSFDDLQASPIPATPPYTGPIAWGNIYNS